MEHSGLSTPPTVLLPFLHLTSRPPGFPLPQDGAEHTGSANLLSNLHLRASPGADKQEPEGHCKSQGATQLKGSPQNAPLP